MPAAPEVVFDEWLDPRVVEGVDVSPSRARASTVTVEPHVGGRVRFDVDDSGTRVLITGQFLDHRPPAPAALHVEQLQLAGPDNGQCRQRRLRTRR